MAKKSGWHRVARVRTGEEPIWGEAGEPSRWELLLRELGVSEAGAVELAQIDPGGRGQAAAIRRFAQTHRWHVFVPEAVLLALGMAVDGEIEASDRWLVARSRGRAMGNGFHPGLGN